MILKPFRQLIRDYVLCSHHLDLEGTDKVKAINRTPGWLKVDYEVVIETHRKCQCEKCTYVHKSRHKAHADNLEELKETVGGVME